MGVLVSVLTASIAAQTPDGSPLTLEAAVARAQEAHPAIAAARLRRATSLGAVAVARERLNPEVRVEVERETPTHAYALAVPIETHGKRQRRIEVGQAGVAVTDSELARTLLDLRIAVRRAYFSRVEADSRLALLQELRALADRALVAAEQRFAAGSAPLLEVLQAELARAEADNQTSAAAGTRLAARAQLNALLARPLDEEVALTDPLDAGPSTIAPGLLTEAEATSRDVVVAERQIDEQRARVALAVAMQTPDVMPEATITRGNGTDFGTGWRLGVAIAVPIFTRQRAGVRVQEAALAQLTAERDAAVARVKGEVTAAAALANAQRQQYLRYRDAIVPQAVRIEQLAEDSYRLGQTGITAYLQALQASRDVRLRMVQAAADYQSALAELERAMGSPLP